MNVNSDELNPQGPDTIDGLIEGNAEYVSDTPKLDYSDLEDPYFDLLSAYIDGEATVSERRQVQDWLDNDPKVHQLYTRMLRLQQSMKHIPGPVSPMSADELSAKVFQAIDEQQKRRSYLGVAVVAVVTLGTLTGFYVKDHSLMPKLAYKSDPLPMKQEQGLMIALNHPVVDIPKEK